MNLHVRHLAFLLLCAPLSAAVTVDFSTTAPDQAADTMRVFGPYDNSSLGSSVSEAVSSRAMAFGDFDGDGLDDLAIGAPLGIGAIASNDGTIWILFGGDGWKRTDVDLSKATVGTRFSHVLPEGGEDHSGQSLTAEDVNGDGVDDLIVGAPLASPLNRFFGGRLTILFGGASFRGRTFDLRQPYGTYGEYRLLPQAASMAMTSSLAAGDYDGDGFGDVAISSQFLNGSTPGVYILHGSAGLPGTTQDLANATTRGTLTFVTPNSGSLIGVNIDTGDFDGDGIDDVAFNSNSRIEILHGASPLPRGTISSSAPPAGVRVTRLSSALFGDRPAISLFDELAIAPGVDELFFGVGNSNTGASPSIRGIFGRISGIAPRAGQTISLDGTAASLMSRIANTTMTGEIGTPLTVEDIDGDGDAELTPTLNASLRGTGLGFNLSQLPASGSAIMSTLPIALTTTANPSTINEFGNAYAVGGDLDGDGAPDLAIAAPYHPDAAGTNNRTGMVGVIFGTNISGESSAARYVRPGGASWRGFAGRRSPRLRLWARLDASASTDPILVGATIHRSAIAAAQAGALPVHWEVTADQEIAATLRFRVTEEELSSPAGNRLVVIRSDDTDGPWVQLPTTRHGRYIIEAHADTVAGFYTIVESPLLEGWVVE